MYYGVDMLEKPFAFALGESAWLLAWRWDNRQESKRSPSARTPLNESKAGKRHDWNTLCQCGHVRLHVYPEFVM